MVARPVAHAAPLPPIAFAFAHHAPALAARLAFLQLRATVARTYSRTTGEVDLSLSFADDEDRAEQLTPALREAFDHLVFVGFTVCQVGVPAKLRLKSYYGPRVSAPATAGPGLAKVIDLETERARRVG